MQSNPHWEGFTEIYVLPRKPISKYLSMPGSPLVELSKTLLGSTRYSHSQDFDRAHIIVDNLIHNSTMSRTLHDLLCATSATMNDEPSNKEVPGFVDQGESKTDSDNQTHSDEGHEAYQFPEGGFRAWLVVSGSAASMFCTFGYLTGFGYVNSDSIEFQRGVLKAKTESTSNGMANTNSNLTLSQTSHGLGRSRFS